EGAQLIDHGVDGVLQLQDFAFHVNRDLARKIAASHGRSHFGNVSNLCREVTRHEVDIVSEIFPGSGDPRHLSLAAQFAFSADFAGHTGHFTGERVQLVHHSVDRVLKFENFAFYINRDFAREIPAGHGSCDLSNVSDLRSEVAGHGIDRIGQIFPGTGHPRHVGLTAKPPFAAHLASHAGHLAGNPVQLVHHRVKSFFELQNFAADVYGDFAGQIAIRDGGCDFRNVSYLGGKVSRHKVYVVREVFPGSGDTWYLSLAAELAFGTDFARHAGHFTGERVQLVHHGVNGFFKFQNFAFDVDRNLAR